jgi:hypothetical protein
VNIHVLPFHVESDPVVFVETEIKASGRMRCRAATSSTACCNYSSKNVFGSDVALHGSLRIYALGDHHDL